MDATPLVDLSPLARLALVGLLLAAAPLAWVGWRQRHAPAAARLRALTFVIVFLTFDLVVFGSFTRLTDSGLGCPDWPGCYGSASPLGAREEIHAAQTALPTGPVTHGKAWIEMIHRYLASAVGFLIIVLTVGAWMVARRGDGASSGTGSARWPLSPWWATASLVWVIAQGAFGALTVTMKLYPAIVTLHLLGGLGLLALLAVQAQVLEPRPLPTARSGRRLLVAVAAALLLQITLGGWVSTNYAVLACTDFPTCQGQWWPPMDAREAFSVIRPLGESASGGYLPFEALTAIHMAHRLGAVLLFSLLIALVVSLWRQGGATPRRLALAWTAMAAWQLVSGLSNVVLGWPLLAAVAHSAGAAAMVVLAALHLTRVAQGRSAEQPLAGRAAAGGLPASARRPDTPLSAAAARPRAH